MYLSANKYGNQADNVNNSQVTIGWSLFEEMLTNTAKL